MSQFGHLEISNITPAEAFTYRSHLPGFQGSGGGHSKMLDAHSDVYSNIQDTHTIHMLTLCCHKIGSTDSTNKPHLN